MRKLTPDEQKELRERIEKARTTTRPESSLGQWIGNILSKGTDALLRDLIKEINHEKNTHFETASMQEEGIVRLSNTLREKKQIDHAIKLGDKYLLIVESKWLKDQRHLNDKGSWILMMSDILLANPELRGIIAVLAGPWESMKDVIAQRAKTILIPLKIVYQVLGTQGVQIKIDEERNAYATPKEALEELLDKTSEYCDKGEDWLEDVGLKIVQRVRKDLKLALEEALLMPEDLTVKKVEIILHTATGNLIRQVHPNVKQANEWLRGLEETTN